MKVRTAGWHREPRRFADFEGLEPEAEWLLEAPRDSEGEKLTPIGRQIFLNRRLVEPQDQDDEKKKVQNGAQAAASADAPSGDGTAAAEEEPPFSFLISPEPGGANGAELAAAIEALGQRGIWVGMTEAERAILRGNGVAGGLCEAAFIEKVQDDGLPFAEMPKVLRLSSALRSGATPPRETTLAAAPDWMESVLRHALGASPYKGAGPVVVGVIDDGFAIAHPRFRFADGTSRIFSFWDQDADFRNPAYDPPRFVPTVPFGRELLSVNPADVDATYPDMPGLNAALAEAKTTKLPVSEFYSLPAMRPFFPPRPTEALRLRSHGTHVLDLAAGAPTKSLKGLPPEPEADVAPALVLVRLPRRSVRETSGAHLEFYLLQGIRHILQRAQMLDADARVVIVSSYGFYGGPLDGASQIERAMDDEVMSRLGRCEIVLPSGNGRLARAHALRRFDEDEVQTIPWQVLPDDRTTSVMEIWSEPYAETLAETPMLALSITTPNGASSSAIDFNDLTRNDRLVLRDADHNIIAQAVCVHPARHPGRRLFLVWLRPTAISGQFDDDTPAQSGVWQVHLRALNPLLTSPARVWIRRDDSLEGFSSGGRQSGIQRDGQRRADDPNLSQLEREAWGNRGWAQRSETMSKIASGSYTVVIGGFELDPAWNFPVPSSAGGPTAQRPNLADPKRLGPDALAPSERAAQQGINAAGFFGGGQVAYRGTSVAAPLVASEIAGAIAQGNYTNGRDHVASLTNQSETTLPQMSSPSHQLGGAGRLITVDISKRAVPFARAGHFKDDT